MKYLCLVYLESAKLHAVADGECMACGDGLRKSGMLLAAEPLYPVETATTVRVRNGAVSVTDGPFAEKRNSAPYCISSRNSADAIIMPSTGRI